MGKPVVGEVVVLIDPGERDHKGDGESSSGEPGQPLVLKGRNRDVQHQDHEGETAEDVLRDQERVVEVQAGVQEIPGRLVM